MRCSARISGLARLGALLALGACSKADKAPTAARPPVEVGVVVLEQQPALLTTELPGRTSAYEVSEVRPQVSGIIRSRLFSEGQTVRAGQTLYQIDARLYDAAEAQARANLMSAEAATQSANARAQRYEPLVKMQAVSELDYADAKSGAEQAAAAVEQARAALQTARINRRYTEVPAPISGRIGRSLVTTGALVTANQAAALSTIQRLDPIFVDMQQSSADLLALRRSLSQGGVVTASTDVELKLEDGSEYGRKGTLQFSEATVDPSTSTVTLRARFDNPDSLLLPGMYVRALLAQSRNPSAILAPQPGITRDAKGNATALVVGPDDKVVLRQIRATRAVGDQWLIEEGLVAGDRLIVEGTGKVKPGQKVRPVPVTSRAEQPTPPRSPQG
jgi:membrane fusion protein (multidrug efflux system)